MILKDKKILLGITGGIAAYKMCDFARSLIKLGANVKVILTPNAKEFVTVTTLQTLTKNPVYSEQFQIEEWKPEHINLADDSDLFIIAPASANTIGKMANGICDNLLTSIFTAFKKTVLIAPAMNCNMWDNPMIQENISKLKANGCNIIEPDSGFLACGYEGKGRLADTEKIKEKAIEILNNNQFLLNKKFIVTAGGTREYIDPVRFIGNESSGKMGIAIADSLYEFGAEVVLISTIQINKPYKVINVKTADDILNTVKENFNSADSLIMAAAVADYKAKNPSESKLKKTNEDTFTIEMIKNPDILKEISKIKKENQTIIGFAAETEDLINNAKKKIESKNLDFIIANDVSNKEIGFNSDYNKASLIDKNGNIKEFEKMTKKELAKKLIKEILMAKTFHIIEKLENFAPPSLAYEWDNSGWQVELNNKKTEKIMLCLSVTKEVLNQAIEKKCDLIIAHHPLIFSKINKISSQNYTNQIIIDAIKNNIQIYSMHTNLDSVKGGIADVLADMLNLKNTTVIDNIDDKNNGIGRIGSLETEITTTELIKQVKTLLNTDKLKVINNSNKEKVKKIAVCPGSGGDYLNRLKGVDAYITADIKYHTALLAENIVLIDAGHFETERIILPKLKELLNEFEVEVEIAEEKEPWVIV